MQNTTRSKKSMIIVIPNLGMLVFRLALLTVFIYILQWPLEKIGTGEYLRNPLAFWFGLAFFMMFPVYFLWTLLGVLWVTISHDYSTICFHYLFKKIRTHFFEIDGYYKTILRTKASSYKGLFIKLKSGKVIEITDYNLKSIREVVNLLQTNKVPLRGDKASWFPFTRRV